MDVERLRLTEGQRLPAKKKPVKRRGEYLGAVPLDWLAEASKLPGKVLVVGLLLWHLRHLRKNLTVRWEPSKAEPFGLARHTVYRALRTLEDAGLVRAQHHRGRCPVVTIIGVAEADGAREPTA